MPQTEMSEDLHQDPVSDLHAPQQYDIYLQWSKQCIVLLCTYALNGPAAQKCALAFVMGF